nr:MAG TPA: hypothetical protein [Caudoviricetes sp.]
MGASRTATPYSFCEIFLERSERKRAKRRTLVRILYSMVCEVKCLSRSYTYEIEV